MHLLLAGVCFLHFSFRIGNITLPEQLLVRDVWMDLSGILKDTGRVEVESGGEVTLWSHASTDPVPQSGSRKSKLFM